MIDDPPLDREANADPPRESPTNAALVAQSLGGWRGAFDAGLPSAVFLLAFVVSGQQLTPSLVAAVSAAVVLAGIRLWRRQPLNQVVSGFIGVAISAFIASRTGRAEDFYLPGLLLNVAYAAVLLVSALVGRPLVGFAFGAFTGDLTGWRTQPLVRRACTQVTLLFAAIFAVRVGVQAPLYLAGLVGPLGVARLVMGYPLYLAGLYVSYRLVSRARSIEAAE